MPREFVPPTECPICGDPVPKGAKSCPGCGADERSGWDDEATLYDGLDLPDEAFVDETKPAPVPRRAPDRVWLALGALLVLAAIMTFIFR